MTLPFDGPSVILFLWALIFIFHFFTRWLKRPRQSDFAAIEAFIKDRNLRLEKTVCHSDSMRYWKIREYWKHWLSGVLSFRGGLARFVIIYARSSDGAGREIHVGFYWPFISKLKELRIVQER